MDFLIIVMLSGAVIFAVGYYFGFRRRKKLDNIGAQPWIERPLS